jgi:phage tail tape-measure protein
MTIKRIALAGAAALAIVSLPLAASAQGVPRGAAEGARVGNQAAGPVVGAAGAVVGGVAGGVVGGVKGVVGIPQRTDVPRSARTTKKRVHRY